MIIYQPKGKAQEYSPLAANLYKGCSHACLYCYAPSATFTDRERFSSPDYITPRKNVIQQLEKDVLKFKDDQRQILLSFTSDCYQPIEMEKKITRHALMMMTKAGLNVTVLTKAGSLAQRDFDLLAKNPKNEFAVTLTTDSNDESIKWEPGAALPHERIANLKAAHEAGIRTWVSFEPVFNFTAPGRLVEMTAPFTDFYKVGKMNYHPIAKEIDWKEFGLNMIRILEYYDKPYLIKDDLKKFIQS